MGGFIKEHSSMSNCALYIIHILLCAVMNEMYDLYELSSSESSLRTVNSTQYIVKRTRLCSWNELKILLI
jgi:uncharacterized protein (UPF0276 family)